MTQPSPNHLFDGTGKSLLNTCGRVIARMKALGYRGMNSCVLTKSKVEHTPPKSKQRSPRGGAAAGGMKPTPPRQGGSGRRK